MNLCCMLPVVQVNYFLQLGSTFCRNPQKRAKKLTGKKLNGK